MSDPTSTRPGDRSRYALRTSRPRHRRVERLTDRLGRVGLDGVLGDLDRAATPCEVPGDAAGPGFTWEARDRDDRTWWPQGVATARGGDVVLVAWYAKRRGLRLDGARVTVVDRSDPDHPRYRHVLLVAPRRRPLPAVVPVHAGGIAVVGDLLLVADTLLGVRVFRLSDIARAPRRTAARGHDYVLPQLAMLRTPLLARGPRLLFSFLSVADVGDGGAGADGAGLPSLVVGEYRRKGGDPRLVRYPLDAATGLPATGPRGRCAPLEVHDHQPPRMQGAAVHDGTWWVTASAGAGKPGDLHVGAPVALHRHRGVLPTGCEDVAWSRPGEELWSATEWPGHRWVFPIDAQRWMGPANADGRHLP